MFPRDPSRCVVCADCVCADLLKALVGVDVVQPGQLVVVQHQRGRVQDQLRRGARQFVQALAGEVQSVRVSAGALDHGGLLTGHLANLQEEQRQINTEPGCLCLQQ